MVKGERVLLSLADRARPVRVQQRNVIFWSATSLRSTFSGYRTTGNPDARVRPLRVRRLYLLSPHDAMLGEAKNRWHAFSHQYRRVRDQLLDFHTPPELKH
ncbi:unnamed protein product, partial [Ectocarpus sp. 12 AP-2014]